MSWTKCQILTTFAAIDAITHILEPFNIKGVQIEELNKAQDDVCLSFYMPSEETTPKTINSIKTNILKLEKTFQINIGSASFSTQRISDDWMTAWEKYYKPIKISEKMMIVPTWENQNFAKDDDTTIIELDPGLAFGTGAHATTILSLQALEKYIDKDETIIDVGSGSGILSIAALLLGAKKVIAIDNDKQAIKSTKQNAALNNVEHSLIVQEGNLLQNVQLNADIIISNILAEVITLFAHDAYDCLKENGLFITSGIIERKKQLVIDSLKSASFNIVEINKQDGWVCIVAQK
ncbi:MAG TPA: 50S ribosomal protein L11 methyltransferase [Bacillota bacterium]|nr:50S ribosomal protein L11 methyltransferase [Bacillota bacterium]